MGMCGYVWFPNFNLCTLLEQFYESVVEYRMEARITNIYNTTKKFWGFVTLLRVFNVVIIFTHYDQGKTMSVIIFITLTTWE